MVTKIYTKTGDKGTTQFGKERVSKDDVRIEAVGVLDQFNSYLGLCDMPERNKIQSALFKIGAAVNGWGELSDSVDDSLIGFIESEIDRLTKKLPELKNFILPNNKYHYARTLARTAERRLVTVSGIQKDVDYSQPLKFLNRISDYLFMLGRDESVKQTGTEEIWTG